MTRITGLEVENFKRVRAISIDPDTNSVVIGGRNAQGKSSVLDGIAAALAGRVGNKDLARPIHEGEKRAKVRVELDDLVVERKWTPTGSTLTVTPRGSSAKLNSPQKVLDELIGNLSFDPLAFAQAESKRQVDTLIDLIGRETFDKIAASRKAVYENRTDANRDLKSVTARLDSMPVVNAIERADIAADMALLEQVQRKEALRAEWQAAQEQIEALLVKQASISTEAANLPSGDPEEIRTRISQAGSINEQADTYERRQALSVEQAGLQRKSEAFTGQIDDLDSMRADLIAKANLPIPGLGFDDDGILYNGIPFSQASAAERLKVSTALAMALNPQLRVICIRDASLLDEDSRAALHALAVEHDYQIWYEVVGKGEETAVIIEDGRVES